MSRCPWSRKLAYGATFRATSAPGTDLPQESACSPPLIYYIFITASSNSIHGVDLIFMPPWCPLAQDRPKSASRWLKMSPNLECDLKLECVKPTAHQGPRQAKNQESRAPSPQPSEECDLN
ncbi:hypothetical protein FA13DRAFT_646197 [Coprinellus micaceus]|uniref:Uncharacterized protein n=1 Tax=Coprinellus micaceus TaxID=71717 RepID=A0A4Y7T5V3_COPMI|nr:hypothetical protein FA13DRAFT_646197 [Coprinellus micaceus]